MRKYILLCLSILCLGGPAYGEPLTLAEVADRMRRFEGDSIPGVDATTLAGKVMCGYQGWFTTPDDGARRGWTHYGRRSRFEPGYCTIDLWPDVSELDQDEKFATSFRHADGAVASVFSSFHRKTVLRHFAWMKQAGQMAHVMNDWKSLVDRMGIGRDSNDRAYLHHGGKPVVAVWGVGFDDGRRYTLAECAELIRFLKHDQRYGGATVMLGVPTGWRTLDRDSVADKALHDVILQADIVSPWTVGRYATLKEVAAHAQQRWRRDIQWCNKHGKQYLPVVFPGFSWHNMKPDFPLDQIPRQKGRFLWSQYVQAKKAGATMIYQAMFDGKAKSETRNMFCPNGNDRRGRIVYHRKQRFSHVQFHATPLSLRPLPVAGLIESVRRPSSGAGRTLATDLGPTPSGPQGGRRTSAARDPEQRWLRRAVLSDRPRDHARQPARTADLAAASGRTSIRSSTARSVPGSATSRTTRRSDPSWTPTWRDNSDATM
jgi:hypothetical protein